MSVNPQNCELNRSILFASRIMFWQRESDNTPCVTSLCIKSVVRFSSWICHGEAISLSSFKVSCEWDSHEGVGLVLACAEWLSWFIHELRLNIFPLHLLEMSLWTMGVIPLDLLHPNLWYVMFTKGVIVDGLSHT